MANRKSRRQSKKGKGKGKGKGMSYADVLAQKQMIRKAAEEAAKDTTVQLKADIHTQRAMWLMVVAMHDAFGIGPERFKRFAEALQDRAEWLNEQIRGADEVFGYEKLRQEASKYSGMEIEYLYEHEILEAQRRAEGSDENTAAL